MARDDSYLYSGMTSLSSEPLTPRQQTREQKQQAKQKLKPGAEILLGLVAKERDAVTDLRSFVLDGQTEESLLAEMRARKLYTGYLNSLETKLKHIMKEAEDEQAAA